MSRIGKKPVAIPSGVTAEMKDGQLSVKGPKGTLSMGLSELVEYKVGPLLAARGYEPSGHPPKPPGAAERLRLWAANKIAVWRAIFDRYGYLDPVLARLAVNLGMRRLARGPQLRMNTKQNQTLK